MALLDGLKNTFINKVLGHILDGNKGSNILGVVIAGVMGANIDYMKAFAGFKFDNATNTTESAKLVGTLITCTFAYFVGKKKVTN
jgi:hypothetical protein